MQIASGYIIAHAILIVIYIVYAALLMWQARYFFGPNKIPLHLIPRIHKKMLMCAVIVGAFQFTLLLDPFGVLPVYPAVLYLFIHAFQFGICGFAYGAYVYYSVKSAFKITFERPVRLWKHLIFIENVMMLVLYCLFTLIAAFQDSVVYLSYLTFAIVIHATTHFVISAICYTKVLMLLSKFMRETDHNPEYLKSSRSVLRGKLFVACFIWVIAVLASLSYGIRYTKNPNIPVISLRDPLHFSFLQSGLVEVANAIIFYTILWAGWLPIGYAGGRSKRYPATPVLYPRKSTPFSQPPKGSLTYVKVRGTRNTESEETLLPQGTEMTHSVDLGSTLPPGTDSDSQRNSILDSDHTIQSFGRCSIRVDPRARYSDFGLSMTDKSSILAPQHFEVLWDAIPENLIHGKCVLLFSLERDGSSFSTFFDKTKNRGPTIIVLKTFDGDIVGGFASHSWQLRNTYYGTGETFLFSFAPQFEKYIWSEDNEYFMLSMNGEHVTTEGSSFIAMGGGDNCGLRISGYFSYATSGPCQTFNSPSLFNEDDEQFKIQLFEVWGFENSLSVTSVGSIQ